jgi:hypothetical protein
LIAKIKCEGLVVVVTKALLDNYDNIVLVAIVGAEDCAHRYASLFTDVWIVLPLNVQLLLKSCWCDVSTIGDAPHAFELSVFSFSHMKRIAAQRGITAKEFNVLAYGCFRGLRNIELNHDHLRERSDSDVRYVLAHELCHCFLATSMGEKKYAAMSISDRELKVDEMVMAWDLPNVTKP